MNYYDVTGADDAPTLGREYEVSAILQRLRKKTPENVSVLGPRFIGKSAVLRAVCAHISQDPAWIASVRIDLRHNTPASDELFRLRIANSVAHALRAKGQADLVDEPVRFAFLDPLADLLEDADQRILIILDGMDSVLGKPGLTRELWDNLLALARRKAFRFVTGSRARLRDLCASEASATSDFWNVFHPNPHFLGAFRDDAWPRLLSPLSGARQFVPEVVTAIRSQTGGIPYLTVALLHQLAERDCATKAVDVEMAAAAVLESDVPGALWNDCDEDLRGHFARVAAEPQTASSLPPDVLRDLTLRGLVHEQGNRVRATAALMVRYARERDPRSALLQQLFAAPADYERNVSSLLSLRFKQIPQSRLPPSLRSKVELSIARLRSECPEDSLLYLRGLVEAALPEMLRVEGAAQVIPPAWMEAWAAADIRERRDPHDVTGERSQQLAVLRLAAKSDPRRRLRPQLKKVSREAVLLVEALDAVGSYGQHRGDGRVPPALLAAWNLLAIEFLAKLNDDLNRGA